MKPVVPIDSSELLSDPTFLRIVQSRFQPYAVALKLAPGLLRAVAQETGIAATSLSELYFALAAGPADTSTTGQAVTALEQAAVVAAPDLPILFDRHPGQTLSLRDAIRDRDISRDGTIFILPARNEIEAREEQEAMRGGRRWAREIDEAIAQTMNKLERQTDSDRSLPELLRRYGRLKQLQTLLRRASRAFPGTQYGLGFDPAYFWRALWYLREDIGRPWFEILKREYEQLWPSRVKLFLWWWVGSPCVPYYRTRVVTHLRWLVAVVAFFAAGWSAAAALIGFAAGWLVELLWCWTWEPAEGWELVLKPSWKPLGDEEEK
jgi:hypothetical protein